MIITDPSEMVLLQDGVFKLES